MSGGAVLFPAVVVANVAVTVVSAAVVAAAVVAATVVAAAVVTSVLLSHAAVHSIPHAVFLLLVVQSNVHSQTSLGPVAPPLMARTQTSLHSTSHIL